jgi:hypothetical protein
VRAGRSRRRARAHSLPGKGTLDEIEIVETITVVVSEELPPATATEELIQPRGSFASGEEALPERDAEQRSHHLGTFAAGEETTPERDAEERSEHLGTFAAGEETMPEKDAAERGHPGTFADTEPQE